MTLRYTHLSPHLRSAVEALNGLTPPALDGHTAEGDLAHNTETEHAERGTH